MAAENVAERKTSGLAIASLVLGIIGLVLCVVGLLPGIPALILGIVALSKIGASQGKLGGKGLAVGGIVTGGLATVFTVLVLPALLLPALVGARGQARKAKCMSNLKQIALACHMYAQDYNEEFPDKLSRLYDEYAYDTDLFVCPSAKGPVVTEANIDEASSYVLVPGRKSTDPADAVLVYDKEDNHGGDGANVAFVDGHVKWVDLATLEGLLTAPPRGP